MEMAIVNRAQKFEYSGIRGKVQRGAYRDWERKSSRNTREGTNFDWWDTDMARDRRTDLIDPKEAVPWAKFLCMGGGGTVGMVCLFVCLFVHGLRKP